VEVLALREPVWSAVSAWITGLGFGGRVEREREGVEERNMFIWKKSACRVSNSTSHRS
jgi:hypothetical protein